MRVDIAKSFSSPSERLAGRCTARNPRIGRAHDGFTGVIGRKIAAIQKFYEIGKVYRRCQQCWRGASTATLASRYLSVPIKGEWRFNMNAGKPRRSPR
jgi:hypothetical protein